MDISICISLLARVHTSCTQSALSVRDLEVLEGPAESWNVFRGHCGSNLQAPWVGSEKGTMFEISKLISKRI